MVLFVLQGLRSETGQNLNGAIVVERPHVSGDGKIHVETEQGRIVKVRKECVRPARKSWTDACCTVTSSDRQAIGPGSMVVVDYLTSEKGLSINGSVALVKHCKGSERVEVQMEDGRTLSIKMEKCRSLRSEWGDLLTDALRVEAASDDKAQENSKPVQRMLLMGATGAGKTAFLNLLCNIDKANELGGSSFEDLSGINDITLENPKSKMQSQTNDATVYRISLKDMTLEVIDTPGLGDTRGVEMDKVHVERIQRAIKIVSCIHCICLIINGRTPRLTFDLKYALQQITTIMPAAVVKNLRVVFTNVSDPLELTFDIDEPEFKDILMISIHDFLCIENPWCKLEKAKQQSGRLSSHHIRESLRKSFNECNATVGPMLRCMSSLKPVLTHEFTELYDAKLAIDSDTLELCEKMMQIAELEQNCRWCAQKVTEALATEHNWARILQQMEAPVLRAVLSKSESVNMVCVHPECKNPEKPGNCHMKCPCMGVGMINSSLFCIAFKKNGVLSGPSVCRHCGHASHWHQRVKLVYKNVFTKRPEEETLSARQEHDSARNKTYHARLSHDEYMKKAMEFQRRRQEVAKQLVLGVVSFQTKALARNYRKVVRGQLDFLKNQIKNLEGTLGGYIAVEQLQKVKAHLEAVLESFDAAQHEAFLDQAFRKKWACSILGLKTQFDLESVKKAFRQKALQFHPDKNAGEEEMFKNVRRAAEILGYGWQ